MSDKFILNSPIVEISSKNKNYKEIVMLVHVLDEENGNGLTFTKEATEKYYNTLIDMPLVARYFPEQDRIGDHEPVFDENGYIIGFNTVPIGTITEAWIGDYQVNAIEKKLALFAKAKIWSYRFPEATRCIENLFSNGNLDTSVEVEVYKYSDDSTLLHRKVKEFSYLSNCILGKGVEPADPNAGVLSISQKEIAMAVKSDLELNLKKEDWGTGEKIEIDNSKESANTSGSWGNVNKTSLRNKILKASNYKSLVKEAYLIVEDGWLDSPSSHLKYPHHFISDGKLVIHKGGLIAARQYLAKNDPDNTSAISHLKKHYKTLEMEWDVEMNNKGGNDVPEKEVTFNFGKEMKIHFESNAMSHDDIRSALWDGLNSEKDENGWTIYRYSIEDVYDTYLVAYDYDDSKYYKMNYSINESENTVTIDKESAVEVKKEWVEINPSTTVVSSEDHEKEINKLKSQYEEEIATKENKIKELETEIEKLNKEIATKDEALEMNEKQYAEKIIKLGESITELQGKLEELQPIKEQYEQMKREKEEKELNEKREALKTFALNSKMIKEEEFENNEEIKNMIMEVNEVGIKALIAERIVEQATAEFNDQKGDVLINTKEPNDLLPQSRREKLYTPREN